MEGLPQSTHFEIRVWSGEVALAEVRLAESEVDEDAAWFAQDTAEQQ